MNCFRLRSTLPVLAMALLLAFAGTARACDPELIDRELQQAYDHLGLAVSADSLDGSRLHLRRVAHAMNDVEAQFISCNCLSAPYQAATTAAEARSAAGASDFNELALSVEGTVVNFELTVLAMQDDLCR